MNKNKQAIMYILLSAIFFSLMSFFVRLSGDVPTYQKAFFRNAIAAVIALPVFLKNHHTFNIGKQNLFSLFLRVSFGTIGMLTNYYAIDHLNLADANMLNKLSPYFAILASIIVLKEFPKKADWIALTIAFCGALLIIKPSFNMQFAYALIGVISGCTSGIAYTFVRKLGKNGVPGPVIVLGFSLFTSTVTLIPSLIFGFQLNFRQFLILMMAGISAACAQFSITAAYSRAAARNISLFEYTQIIFAAMWGFLFLHQIPDILSIGGYIIIISCAIFKQQANARENA